MATISEIIGRKGTTTHTVTPDTTVFEAIGIMSEKNIGALLVMDDDKIEGIFTERDYLNRIVLKNRTSRSMMVSAVMTKKVVYIELDDDLNDAMTIMTECQLRHLPVLDKGKVMGVVSITDLAAQVTKRRELAVNNVRDQAIVEEQLKSRESRA